MAHWYDIIFELIDMRSFSSLWYWIALAVMWSSTSHWVLGVPWDMVTRARRYEDPGNIRDLEEILRINCNRIEFIIRKFGPVLAGMLFFILTILLMLGFVYGNEFSQAVFLMVMPMSLVLLLSIKVAKTIKQQQLRGAALYKKLYIHRLILQMLGTFSIFLTAMWGMYQNISSNAFGVF
ncbi:hypothetical protein MNBD_ALPHA07-622 [hydrothermal vent metagenome]|uniref:Component of SufBCD complex n=1 Tax=hydrothermal vent metagenome TaxID=652676 RepID=A0A3B0RES9_9ZZZZ